MPEIREALPMVSGLESFSLDTTSFDKPDIVSRIRSGIYSSELHGGILWFMGLVKNRCKSFSYFFSSWGIKLGWIIEKMCIYLMLDVILDVEGETLFTQFNCWFEYCCYQYWTMYIMSRFPCTTSSILFCLSVCDHTSFPLINYIVLFLIRSLSSILAPSLKYTMTKYT